MRNKSKSDIAFQVIIILFSICVFGLIVWIIIDNTAKGWTSQMIIDCVYAACAASIGMIFYVSFEKFLIAKNFKVLILKNDIYRIVDKASKSSDLNEIKNKFIQKNRENILAKLNNILSKYKKFPVLTTDNIDYFFDYQNKNGFHHFSFFLFKEIYIGNLYKKYCINTTKEFEILLRSVMNKSFISQPKFPLVELLIPLFFGLIGAFASLYQSLSEKGTIQNNLLDYFKVFCSISILFLCFALFSSNSMIESEVKKLSELKAFLED